MTGYSGVLWDPPPRTKGLFFYLKFLGRQCLSFTVLTLDLVTEGVPLFTDPDDREIEDIESPSLSPPDPGGANEVRRRETPGVKVQTETCRGHLVLGEGSMYLGSYSVCFYGK